MKQNMDRNRTEQAGKGGVKRISDSVTAKEQAVVGLAKLTLSLNPGHPVVRQQVVRLRQDLMTRLSPDDPGYVAVAELTALLDRDALAQIHRRAGGEVVELGPASRQDPVVSLYRLRRIDDEQLRAAREIQQVAEIFGGVGGVKVVDPAAIRVDGGGAGDFMLATYRAGHYAAARVGDFMARLMADSRQFAGRDGRCWTAADIFRAVVVFRRAQAEVEKKVVCRHGVVTGLVGELLDEYARDAAGVWAVMDAAKRRKA